jgi:hypothetical protein
MIGTRTLTIETDTGKKPVEIRVFAPFASAHIWECHYEIDWPEGTVKSRVEGNDALHALELVQQKIGVDLYMSRYHKARSMRWLEGWTGYGFPLPKNGRDLLIGDDKTYFG